MNSEIRARTYDVGAPGLVGPSLRFARRPHLQERLQARPTVGKAVSGGASLFPPSGDCAPRHVRDELGPRCRRLSRGGRGRWAGERVASPTRSRRGFAPRCTSGLWSLGLVRLIAAKPVDLILERRQKLVVGGQRLRLGREGCFVLGELGFEGGSADGTGLLESADIDLQLG